MGQAHQVKCRLVCYFSGQSKRKRIDISSEATELLESAWSAGLTSVRSENQRQKVQSLAVQLNLPNNVLKVGLIKKLELGVLRRRDAGGLLLLLG